MFIPGAMKTNKWHDADKKKIKKLWELRKGDKGINEGKLLIISRSVFPTSKIQNLKLIYFTKDVKCVCVDDLTNSIKRSLPNPTSPMK